MGGRITPENYSCFFVYSSSVVGSLSLDRKEGANVSACCKGKKPTYLGYKWMYTDEYENKKNDSIEYSMSVFKSNFFSKHAIAFCSFIKVISIGFNFILRAILDLFYVKKAAQNISGSLLLI